MISLKKDINKNYRDILVEKQNQIIVGKDIEPHHYAYRNLMNVEKRHFEKYMPRFMRMSPAMKFDRFSPDEDLGHNIVYQTLDTIKAHTITKYEMTI